MRAAMMGRYTITNQVGTLKFNVVYGPALTDVLSRYTGFTGRPALPPPFAFGPWISSDIWRDRGEVNYAVTNFRERGIPVSAFVFDSPWEVAYNDFKFNIGDSGKTQFGYPCTFEGLFPGFTKLTDMMTFLRKNGLKVICWMTSFINVTSNDEHVRGQNLGEAKPDKKVDRSFVRASKDGPPLVVPWWNGRGSPIDFTNVVHREAVRRLPVQPGLVVHRDRRQLGRVPPLPEPGLPACEPRRPARLRGADRRARLRFRTERFGDSLSQTGAIYKLAPARTGAAKRLGLWNTYEIEAPAAGSSFASTVSWSATSSSTPALGHSAATWACSITPDGCGSATFGSPSFDSKRFSFLASKETSSDGDCECTQWRRPHLRLRTPPGANLPGIGAPCAGRSRPGGHAPRERLDLRAAGRHGRRTGPDDWPGCILVAASRRLRTCPGPWRDEHHGATDVPRGRGVALRGHRLERAAAGPYLVTAASDPGEHFYGFGERFNSIEQAGRLSSTRRSTTPVTSSTRTTKIATISATSPPGSSAAAATGSTSSRRPRARSTCVPRLA